MFKIAFYLFLFFQKSKGFLNILNLAPIKKGLPQDRPFLKCFKTLLFNFGNFYHVGR
jgi:hypothetical protein